MAIWKDLLTKGVEERRDLRMNCGTKSGKKNTWGEELMTFCSTSTACRTQPSEWAIRLSRRAVQGKGKVLESRPCPTTDLVQGAKGL